MEIRETKEQPTISVRMTTNLKNISQDMGKAFGEIMQYMGEKQVNPIGPPYAMYYNEDMDNLDTEVGFPVAQPLPEKGKVKMSKLPGGKAVVGMHIGPYNKLGDAYTEITEWMKEKDIESPNMCYEIYLNDPENTPENELKTEIYFPIK
jgi:effector-binding domain-containing protein